MTVIEYFAAKNPNKARSHYLNGKLISQKVFDRIFASATILTTSAPEKTRAGWSIEHTIILR